jgi:nucleotide-binding universal stress UspA family protein
MLVTRNYGLRAFSLLLDERQIRRPEMTLNTIVSYDGTPNDDDALAFARVLSQAGANLILAYVRHSTDNRDEAQAQALLERGAAKLGGQVETRVVLNRSTSEGLKQLAHDENAQLIVFGSDYRTSAGRIAPQKSTQSLLDGGPTAVAIAPAGYAGHEIKTIGLLAGLDDHAAIDTAHGIASHFGAEVTDKNYNVDLLIVGSRPEAHEGQTMISAQAENALVGTSAPVLVVGRGSVLSFGARVFAA